MGKTTRESSQIKVETRTPQKLGDGEFLMGTPQKKPWKTRGKPWENHGNMVISWGKMLETIWFQWTMMI